MAAPRSCTSNGGFSTPLDFNGPAFPLERGGENTRMDDALTTLRPISKKQAPPEGRGPGYADMH